MPTLPSSDTIQRQTPQNRRGFTQIGTPPDEQAQVNLGRSISNAGSMIAEANDYRSSVQAEDAMNQLAMADVELNAKLSTIKGGDAANQDLMGNFTKEREAKINEIKAGMKNSQAIGKFDSGVAKSSARFGATVLQHQLKEAEDYRVMVDKAGIEASSATIGQNFNNEAFVNETLDGMRKKTAEVAAMNGIIDPVARTVFAQSRLGQAHLAFVDSALDGGDSIAAERHLALYKAEMTSQQIDYAEKRIKPNADWAAGQALADAYTIDLASMSPSEAMDKMRASSNGNKDAFDNAKGVISDDRVAEQQASLDSQGTVYLQWESKLPTRSNANAVLGSKAFNRMSDRDKAEVKKSINNDLDVKGRQREVDLSNSNDAYEKYLELLNDENFASKTYKDFAAQRHIIGLLNVRSLQEELARQKSGAAKDRIDADFLKEATIGLGAPAKLAVNAISEREFIGWKSRNPGKIASMEEKQRIVAAAFEKYTEVDGFVYNEENSRYKLEGKGKGAVPSLVHDALKDIASPDEMLQFQAVIKSTGRQFSPENIPVAFARLKKEGMIGGKQGFKTLSGKF